MSATPNILIIVIDSLRADRVGCYGYKRDTTPRLDQLAAEGTRFTQAITAAPFSPASYASIISNRYPHQHGVNGDTVRVWPNAMPRLPEYLRAMGYSTFALSNNSFFLTETNSATGFDVFVDRDDSWQTKLASRSYQRVRRHFGDDVAKRLSNRMHCQPKGDSARTLGLAAELIRTQQQPWFGFVILMDPHTPYDQRRTHYVGHDSQSKRDAKRFFRESNHRAMWAELMAERGMLDEVDSRIVRDLYDSETRYADACVGELIDDLRDSGELDNTVLAVTADHGEAFGEHRVWGHGFCLNDALTRVPLIVRHPDTFAAGASYDGLVQLHDLHDTCIDIADGGDNGERYPQSLTQANHVLWPGREAVFSEFPLQSKTLAFMRDRNPQFEAGRWGYDMCAVRTHEWRYIAYENGPSELYNLKQDPGETADVSKDHANVCAELSARIEAHLSDQPYTPVEEDAEQEMDEAVKERLRALGYIE